MNRRAWWLAASALLITGPAAARQGPPRPEMRITGLLIPVWSADLGPGAGGDNRFEISRAYLTVSGRLSERVAARITTDAIREDGEELEVRLKYGFIAYRPRVGAPTFRFGLTHPPFIEFEEAMWEHRMQGPMPADRLGFMSSSDLGFAVDQTWGAGDRVQITAGVFNGEGWARGNGDAGKDLMVRATVRVAASDDPGPLGGLRLTGYGQTGSPTGGGIRRRTLGMASWRSSHLTVAAQMLATSDRSDATAGAGTEPIDALLLNGFMLIKVPETTVVLIGRLERFDPDRSVAGNRQTRWTGGVGVRLAPELRLLGSLEHLSYEHGAPTPALDAARVRALVHAALTF